MAKKDDCLGLSLSLRCPENLNPDPLPPTPPKRLAAAAHFPLSLFRSPSPFMQLQKISRTDAFQTAAARQAEPRTFLGGIDINRTLTVVECDGEDEDEDEEGMVTSPNSTVSSISGKRNEREENDGERAASSSMEIEEDGGDAASRKKLRLSKVQAAVLEETFKEHSTLNPVTKNGFSKKARSEASAGGGVVSEQKGEDKVEANRGRLRVLEPLLREFDRRKQTIAEGSEGSPSSEALPAILRQHDPSNHTHYVPPVRACGLCCSPQPPTAHVGCGQTSRAQIVIEEGADMGIL
ncbi:homeobox-leucine zipper protein HAT3-like isoform X1 [Primulina huaijiensis]|uniref:homeobox-leucine zipper protein HAT3-like isoform X1 n=1 Tax=Primulina huaijiensis TaxID=1492673 RepID=UPI003CC723A9